MNRRWLCPRCGKGLLAPSRPRKDDVRRYCLPCSKSTGRLVARTCPAIEAERTAKTEHRQAAALERRTRKRERESARWTVEALDLRDELKRLWRLPFVKMLAEERGRFRLPAMTISRSKVKGYTTGRAWGSRRMHLTLAANCSRKDAEHVLAHELTHLILPSKTHHSERFHHTFARLLEDAYGIPIESGRPI